MWSRCRRRRSRIGNETRTVTNLNELVGRVSWVNGVKTGHTLDAGYVLVGSGTRGGMTLISAVLGASSESARAADTLALLKWGFDNFRLAKPVSIGQVVTRLPVRGRARSQGGAAGGGLVQPGRPQAGAGDDGPECPASAEGPVAQRRSRR